MMSNSFTRRPPSSARGPAKPLRLRRLVEHGVDEAEALRGPVALRELDGLVDHDLRRHVRPVPQLRQRDEQNRAADRVELLERAGRKTRDGPIEDRRLVDGESKQDPKVEPIDLRELRRLRELPLELVDVVPPDLPLIQ